MARVVQQLSLVSFTVELYPLPDLYDDDHSNLVLAPMVDKLNTSCSGTDKIRVIQHFAEYYYDPAVAHWDRVSMMWKTRPRELADQHLFRRLPCSVTRHAD